MSHQKVSALLKYIGCFLFFMATNMDAQVPFVCEGQFFLSHSAGAQSPTTLSELFIDPITSQVSFVTIKETPVNFNAMGFRSTDQLIYGIDPRSWHLYQIDALGEVKLLRTITEHADKQSFGGGITPDGKYLVQFAFKQGLSNDVELVLINLESPTYNTIVRPVVGNENLVFDLAFDPTNGDMYGIEASTKRLLKIDVNTGVVTKKFPPSNLIEIIGGVFFDPFGNLYAYGGINNGSSDAAIFSVNKNTGTIRFLGDGPQAMGNDACSCPYTVKLAKSVKPRQAYPCDTVEYTFIITNQSSRDPGGVTFQDILPPGFTFLEIKKNPFGGIVSGQGTDVVSIEGLLLPFGTDTFSILARVGEIDAGIYANQAVLFNLPPSLGTSTVSDDPQTFEIEDSTRIEVLEEQLNGRNDTMFICRGDNKEVFISDFMVDVLWQDGSRAVSRILSEPGQYLVNILIGCNSRIDTFTVIEHLVKVEFVPNLMDVVLGDIIEIEPLIGNSGIETKYDWQDDSEYKSECYNCPTFITQPSELFPITLSIENEFGCKDTAIIRFTTERKLFIPNAFTPNSDGKNDFFLPLGSGFKKIELTIFDRWGGEVYHYKGGFSEAFSGWNGFNAKSIQCFSGVYAFNCQIIYIDGFSIQKSGNISLLR